MCRCCCCCSCSCSCSSLFFLVFISDFIFFFFFPSSSPSNVFNPDRYFWYHTAFLNKTSNESATVRPSRLSMSEDDAVRPDPISGGDSVILHLDRNHLDNGHHNKNQKVLPEKFCIDLKFRPATAEEIRDAGEYVPKHFEDVLVGGGSGTSSEAPTHDGGVEVVVDDNHENGNDHDELLNAQSPWSRK